MHGSQELQAAMANLRPPFPTKRSMYTTMEQNVHAPVAPAPHKETQAETTLLTPS